jgi:hypothetical protein
VWSEVLRDSQSWYSACCSLIDIGSHVQVRASSTLREEDADA